MSRIQIVFLLTSLAVTGFVVEQVRRRRLAVEYSLIWIVAGLVMIGLSLWRNGIEYLAAALGIFYAPSAIFIVFGVVVLLLNIHFSLVLSRLSSQNRVLVQRLALLENEQAKHQPEDRPQSRRG